MDKDQEIELLKAKIKALELKVLELKLELGFELLKLKAVEDSFKSIPQVPVYPQGIPWSPYPIITYGN